MSINVEWLIQRANSERTFSRQHRLAPNDGGEVYGSRTLCGLTIPALCAAVLRIDYGAPDRSEGKCRHCRRIARLLDKEN